MSTEDAEAISIARKLIAEKKDKLVVELADDNQDDGYRKIDSINEYQQKIEQFAIFPKEQALVYLSLGLASEAGEVAGKVKKVIRDGNGEFTDEQKLAILAEIGDVAWYMSMLASTIGVDMSDVLAENYYKLEFRASRGMIAGSGDNR